MTIPEDYVQMEQHVCPVCGVVHKHNTSILIHKQLKSIPKDQTVTGYGLCEEHDRLHKEGYLALVGATSKDPNADTLDIKNAHYTGEIIHIRYSAVEKIFNTPIDPSLSMVFIEPEAIEKIKQIMRDNGLDVPTDKE